jgi:hypothetical protein
MEVNGFVSAAREHLPPDLNLRGDDAQADAMRQAMVTVHIGVERVAQEIPRVGEVMRSPSIVSDRWALITELQTFRGRFRDLIGAIVYETASCFGELSRRESVPGFNQQLKAAISLRAVSADLGRLLAARRIKVDQAQPEDLQWHADQLDKELNSFAGTGGYRSLRAQDKREFIELRTKLTQLAQSPAPEKRDLLGLILAFGAWVEGLAELNKRQILVEHDREVWAGVGVKLEQVDSQVRRQPQAAGKSLAEAVQLAQALYGRDGALDAFLRKAKKTPLATLDADEVKTTLDQFRELLANLPVLG